jgi:hypothetical protein
MKRILYGLFMSAIFSAAIPSTWGDKFLYSNVVFTTINVPGSTNTVDSGINDAGQIVGTYTDASGTARNTSVARYRTHRFGWDATTQQVTLAQEWPRPAPESHIVMANRLLNFWAF